MLEKKEYLEIHSKFYDYLVGTSCDPELYLPYDTYDFSASLAKGPKWFLFASQAKEFIREILNSINQFYDFPIAVTENLECP